MPGGGKPTGGGSTSQTTNTSGTTSNVFPGFAGGLDRISAILSGGDQALIEGTGRDSLLQVPGQSSAALGGGLDFLSQLFAGQDPGTQGLINFQTLINEGLGQDRFNDATDRFETIGNRAEGAFAPFIQAALSLGQQGANPEFRNILAGFANEDPFSNPFVNRITSDALADQEAARIDAAVQSGGLGGPGQSQIAQREAGRLSADIRGRFGESSRDRALRAAGTGAQFDLTDAAQRLNALIGGGNLTNQRFGTELGAAEGVLRGAGAEEARRNQLLAFRAANEGALAGLPFQGLNAAGPLASTFAELPFSPLANFAAIAANPSLFQTTQSTSDRTTETEPGLFDTIGNVANLGLVGAGLFGGGGPLSGVFGGGTALTGSSGLPFDVFSGGGFGGSVNPATGIPFGFEL